MKPEQENPEERPEADDREEPGSLQLQQYRVHFGKNSKEYTRRMRILQNTGRQRNRTCTKSCHRSATLSPSITILRSRLVLEAAGLSLLLLIGTWGSNEH